MLYVSLRAHMYMHKVNCTASSCKLERIFPQKKYLRHEIDLSMQFVPCKFCEGVGHLTPLNESKGELGNLKTT